MKNISCYVQKAFWYVGLGIHNPLTDECTPDFNCCVKFRGVSVYCKSCGLHYNRDKGNSLDLSQCTECGSEGLNLSDASDLQRFNLIGPPDED